MRTHPYGTKMTRRRLLGAFLILAAAAVPALPAAAQSLNDLRASGAIGEAYDGFARARDGAYQSVVASTNAKRRAIYEERAKAQSIGIDQVGRVYADQIMSKAPKGTWFLTASGNWVRK